MILWPDFCKIHENDFLRLDYYNRAAVHGYPLGTYALGSQQEERH